MKSAAGAILAMAALIMTMLVQPVAAASPCLGVSCGANGSTIVVSGTILGPPARQSGVAGSAVAQQIESCDAVAAKYPALCGAFVGSCIALSSADSPLIAVVVESVTAGAVTSATAECQPPAAVGPVVTQAAVREVVSRLVPSPAVGTPWPWSVVNFPVLLWLDTAADRVLPPVSVVGVPVRVRVRVASVSWDFGDGDSASTADPGIAYDPAQPCGACAGRFGHVFRRAGVVRVSAVVSWSVQFATPGQGWTDLEGTVSGPVSGVAIRLREAHSVLLPDPGH